MTALEVARREAGAVVDPELPMLTLADLGILRGIEVDADGARVRVVITPTYSACPAVAEIRAAIVRRLRETGFDEVDVALRLDPPWSTDDITPHGRTLLAEHGIAPPGPAGRPVTVQLGVQVAAPPCPRCASADTVVQSPFGPTACTALCRCRACGEPFEHVRPH